ncbi:MULTISPECIES: hypothetical protein [unclassified Paenibacillus]|uniref:hypothetical protein n=1 Tax=unclassified Paenibacillus TaxID=185978 RepID=UPI002784B9F3|nr:MULTISPECIES: hypothetical protein [unclassified Paenibacillus]MDQ0903497.1 hypothetical protein [Paenibacillus sp. V4I7]MDQ0918025.1 hypothetical protein [Paenibacillus sp. V4I5]
MIIIISVVALTFLGGYEGTKIEKQQAQGEEQIGSKSEVTEGDFVYRLISGKSTYSQGEKVDLYAELEYVGEGKEIEIAHAASPFYFPITEKTRGFEIIYMMNMPRIVTLLKKGEPLRERYRGGGGYRSEDPKEYVDFIKEVAESYRASGSLPWGEYEVSGVARFTPLHGSAKEEMKEIQIKAKVAFRVDK